MNLFELFVKIGVDDQASGKLSKLSASLGKGLATAAKIGAAAVSAAAAGITALTTAAVNNYAEYEQLIGGAQLMFGKAYDTVAKNAQDAYKTVQMSQNEYLQQVNGLATGLKTALGGNEQAAAELAHKIVQAEADIIAATGNTAENVQNAFNGIMKSNFTMLDNLQIGITPTKEGFQEVIDKVNEWNKANGEATKYQMGNLADMQSALVDYIDMVGMSGYAQREASETITGSLSSTKAAWTNLVTGFADDSADLDKLIGNLTDSVVGYTDESGKHVKGVLDNLLPAIEKSLGGIAKLIEGAAPKIIAILPGLVERIVPSVISAATGMVDAVVRVLPNLLNTVVDAIIYNAPTLIGSAIVLIGELSNGILSQLPKIVALGLDLIVSLAEGISENFEELLPVILETVLKIGEVLIEHAPELINAGIELAAAVIGGILEQFGDFAPLITGVVAAFTAYNAVVNAGKIATAAMTIATKAAAAAQWLVNAALNANPIGIVVALIAGLVTAIITLWHTNEDFRKALISAWNAIKNIAIAVWGSIVKFFTEDIPNAFNAVINFVEENWQSLLLLIVNPIAGALNLLYDLNPKFKEWVDNLISKIKSWISGMVNIGKEIVNGLKNGIQKAWRSVIDWFSGAFDSLREVFSDWGVFFSGLWEEACGIFSSAYFEFLQIGRNIVNGIREGIRNTWQSFKNWFNNLWDSLFKNRDIDVGIYGGGSGGGSGGDTGPGAGPGRMNTARDVVFNSSLIPTNDKNDSSSRAVFGDIYINVYASEYENQKDLVEEIAQRLQSMTERRSAVYA